MKKVIKKKKQSKKNQKGAVGNIFIFGILILLTLTAFTAVGGIPSASSPQSGTPVQIATPAQESSRSTLQLETFGYTTIVPTAVTTPQTVNTPPQQTLTIIPHPPITAPYCGFIDDNGVLVNDTCRCLDLDVICQNGKGYTDSGQPFAIPEGDVPPGYMAGQDPCGTRIAPNDGRYCVAKPVIYLYPTSPTAVTVQVITTGKVVVSDPTYPQGGWKNILAFPNGTFQYEDNQYSELFYESSVTDFQKPPNGITIATDQLSEELNTILDQLGLVGHEKQEFLSYWIPRLQALNAPYIYFSLLNASAKSTVDHVIISPTPDTQIEFIAYFKPLTNPLENTLQLPPTPQRKGFVSVEWGGVLDK